MEENWCSDYVVSSYTPTLSALLRARRDGLKPVSSKTLKVLLVAEPEAPGTPPIPKVMDEVKIVSQIMTEGGYSDNLTSLEGANGATVSSVLSALPNTALLHLACHGQQDRASALESGFCLRDGRLTVAALMRLNLSAPLLAFLSACETAKGDEKQPDQAVHLAAAMLFVGFRSVIATMW
jgi:CHAT domain-containing protein